ncbi:MAG: sodium transport system ATP-binding protein [Planctomycetaceae bacterium]|jgi:sodium transport system ATP-binding protein
MIQVENLTKYFKSGKQVIKAVDNISFSAADGQITGLLGPNGAGKSTTLRILYTAYQPDSGIAKIDKHSVVDDSFKVRGSIGVLTHNAGIYERLTARENIRYFGELHGMRGSELEKRIDELADLLEMKDFLERRGKGFSQGQKTKTALARALVHSPKNILLDEPTNGLDVMATRGLREVILRLKEAGHCVLFSSHVMQEVAALCDEIIIIAAGKVVARGTPAELRAQTNQESLEDAFVSAIGSAEGLV